MTPLCYIQLKVQDVVTRYIFVHSVFSSHQYPTIINFAFHGKYNAPFTLTEKLIKFE